MAVVDPHVTGVGRVTMAHSNLDFTLTLMFVGLVHADKKIGYLLLGKMRYDEKVDLLRRVLPLVTKSRRYEEVLARLHPRLKKAGALRNDIVHAAWSSDDPENPTWHISQTNWSKNLNRVGELIMKQQTPESLEAIAEEINSIHEELLHFATQVGAIPWKDHERAKELGLPDDALDSTE